MTPYVPRTYVPPDRKMRRLYCLECGSGAWTELPNQWFVEQHTRLHGFAADDVKDRFVVVDRGKDRTIHLGEQLDKMLTTVGLVWSGALGEDEESVEELIAGDH